MTDPLDRVPDELLPPPPGTLCTHCRCTLDNGACRTVECVAYQPLLWSENEGDW